MSSSDVVNSGALLIASALLVMLGLASVGQQVGLFIDMQLWFRPCVDCGLVLFLRLSSGLCTWQFVSAASDSCLPAKQTRSCGGSTKGEVR
jgi:hypothetical protein